MERNKTNQIKESIVNFCSLPDEIIITIMELSSYSECNSLMRTCKRYNNLLKSCQGLWKLFYKQTAGKEMYALTATHSKGDWLGNMRYYLCLERTLINMILHMSQKHFKDYSQSCELNDIQDVFTIALSSNTSYYCTLSILQKYTQKGLKQVDSMETEAPYTLTELHYAKGMLRSLVQVFLVIKWTRNTVSIPLTPEYVLNLMTQWLDPLEMHTDEEVNDLIKEMICDVDEILILAKKLQNRTPGDNTHETCEKGIYTEREVLSATSNYMYKHRRMVMVEALTYESLNVVMTIKSNSGNSVALGAIFEAIVRAFGVTSCKLVYFAQHVFLIWQPAGERRRTYHMNLANGSVQPLGRCPYSEGRSRQRTYEYSSESMMSTLILSFTASMGEHVTWQGTNARSLMDFLADNPRSDYDNFMVYIHSLLKLKNINYPFKMEYIDNDTIKCIRGLLTLAKGRAENEARLKRLAFGEAYLIKAKKMYVNRRPSELKYAIGLICYHKSFDYLCVIRGWDVRYLARRETQEVVQDDKPKSPFDQPQYLIIAADQTERRVPEDELTVFRSGRIFHLEEMLCREFSHFNGFFYVPNKFKQAEYPDDLPVCMKYSSMSFNPI